MRRAFATLVEIADAVAMCGVGLWLGVRTLREERRKHRRRRR